MQEMRSKAKDTGEKKVPVKRAETEKKEVAKQEPWREISELRRDFDDMLEHFFGGWPLLRRPGLLAPLQRARSIFETRGWAPRVDLLDQKDNILVRAEIPGVDPKDIDVTIHKGMVTIEGDRKTEREYEKGDYYFCEGSYGKFYRSFGLPEEVDEARAKASHKDGVLEITLPKMAPAAKKKIKIAA
jgi:HSP20 family protein